MSDEKPMAHPPGDPAPDPHAGIDISHLPEVEFGAKNLLWWGTFGFIAIEGFTLLLMIAAYLYLRLNFQSWPPETVDDPDLLIPTISTLLMILVVVPMVIVDKAAHRFDRLAVGKWMAIAGSLTAVAVVLRTLEFTALDVRWDTNAYGSVVWGLLILHTTLLLTDLAETAIFAVLFLTGRAQNKHFSDASDGALYQYFLSAAAIPVYLVIYWGPRIL